MKGGGEGKRRKEKRERDDTDSGNGARDEGGSVVSMHRVTNEVEKRG